MEAKRHVLLSGIILVILAQTRILENHGTRIITNRYIYHQYRAIVDYYYTEMQYLDLKSWEII